MSIMSRLDLQKIGRLFPQRQSKLSVIMGCPYEWVSLYCSTVKEGWQGLKYYLFVYSFIYSFYCLSFRVVAKVSSCLINAIIELVGRGIVQLEVLLVLFSFCFLWKWPEFMLIVASENPPYPQLLYSGSPELAVWTYIPLYNTLCKSSG